MALENEVAVKVVAYDNTKSGIDSAKRGISSLDSAAQSLAKGLGVATLATTALGVAFNQVSKAISIADKLDKLNKQFGISFRSIQQLDYIGRQFGTSSDAMAIGFKTIASNAYDAANGSDKAAALFDTLNVSITDSAGNLKSNNEIFFSTIDALSKIKNETERTALATDAFGRSAMEILPVLSSSSEELKKMSDEASKMGQIMTDEAVRNIDNFGDAIGNLGKSITTAIANTMNNPQTAGFVDMLTKMVAAGDIKSSSAATSSAASNLRDLIGGVGLMSQPQAPTPPPEDDPAIKAMAERQREWNRVMADEKPAMAILNREKITIAANISMQESNEKYYKNLQLQQEGIAYASQLEQELAIQSATTQVEARKFMQEELDKTNKEIADSDIRLALLKEKLAKQEQERMWNQVQFSADTAVSLAQTAENLMRAYKADAEDMKAIRLALIWVEAGAASASAWRAAAQSSSSWQELLIAGIAAEATIVGNAIAQTALVNDQQFAMGGRPRGGGMALVGEQGPEIAQFDSPGYVSTAAETRQMLNGGVGSTQSLTVHFHNSNGTDETLKAQVRAGQLDGFIRAIEKRSQSVGRSYN